MVAVTTFICMPSEMYFAVQKGSSLSQGVHAPFKLPAAKMRERIEKYIAAKS